VEETGENLSEKGGKEKGDAGPRGLRIGEGQKRISGGPKFKQSDFGSMKKMKRRHPAQKEGLKLKP